ncbi:MAG: pantetheine-phosphate adenylyltransferase [Elusimicrobia bacterium]|nr:pantetheine-phosphate adenylyltransferase [Elusimicrobiota bacterium]
MTTAVYPGSFDPVTLGHLDLVERACRIFDRVVVAVSNNSSKKHTFSVAERIAMLENAVRAIPQAEVDTFSGLLVDYLKHQKATTVIRGLRAVSDLDYEFQMASMNRRLYPKVETVFLMPDEQYTYLSSSMVKEVARMGAPLDGIVAPFVARKLRLKFKTPVSR